MPDPLYHVSGHAVDRTAWPRCRFVMQPRPDGSWICDNPDWLDDPSGRDMPADELAALCARIAREAGDAWLEHHHGDS